MHHRTRLAQSILLAAVVACPERALAQPAVQLRLPANGDVRFENFSSVVLPAGVTNVEVWIEGALGDIELSSVRVRLNEMSMTSFVSLNPLPRGLRAIVSFSATLRPEYNLRPSAENLLTLEAADTGRTSYRAQFYLWVDEQSRAPRLAPTQHRAPAETLTPPLLHKPPTARFTSEWPASTTERIMELNAEVVDAEGLRRIVIEVNNKDVEEVVLENEQPVRKKNGWIARGKLPGTVVGDGRKVMLSIPVTLNKELNVVAIRVENVLGLRTNINRTVQRPKK